jgi:hypothetical protein
VTDEASSKARNATTEAISSVRPERPSGTPAKAALFVAPEAAPVVRATSASMRSHMRVAVTWPGQHALAVMPWGASSTAMLCVKPITANLLAA